jgi:uncharacterized protein YkwD
MRRCALVAVVLASACSGTPPRPSASSGPTTTPTTTPASASTAKTAPTAMAGGSTKDPRPLADKLTIAQARRYMLQLINRDRASQGLGPVELDEGPPTAAGQAHAEDMAQNGYLGHWGTDGSVPEQRLTEAGGADMVLENALCFTDEQKRRLDPSPLIDAKEIEKSESMFFNEVPPNDGHRRNILKPFHTHVGIGVAQPVATATEIPVPCFAQEFVDRYGTYNPLPKKAKASTKVRVEGHVEPRAPFGGVGVARLDAPKPLPPSELNKRRSYPVPEPRQMYWPKGFKTPIPVQVDGGRFHIDVPLSDGPGLYEISVWAKLPGGPPGGFAMVSLRTLHVE